MRHVTPESLQPLMSQILNRTGTKPDVAEFMATSLVDANLAGHDSHGVLRLPFYVSQAREGIVDPGADAVVIRTHKATAVVDACTGWGQPAMWLATQTAIELARDYGVGTAVVRRCFHIGRVAPYVEAIAAEGMIGIAMANAAPAVAPFGGSTRVMGTNPIAWAVPRADGKPPICHDIATAIIAEGKLQVARSKGLPVADGLLVDTEGRPTTNPHDFYSGGTILPFGAHKGGGLSVLAQFIGRGLAGMDPSDFTGPRGLNGPFVLALDIAPFVALGEFIDHIEKQSETILASPPMQGVDEVMLPGDPELRSREARAHSGIPIPDPIWDQLAQLAAELDLMHLLNAAETSRSA